MSTCTSTYHVCLSCLLNVVSGDDDGGLLRGDQLQQVVPNPTDKQYTSNVKCNTPKVYPGFKRFVHQLISDFSRF